MANSRTVLEFESNADIWTVIKAWAKETGYRQVDSGDSWRRYQKGHGIFMAPMILEVHREDSNKVRLEAWVYTNTLSRIMALFLVPSEINIGSGGLGVKMPRIMARKHVNILLDRLGQPPIE